MIKMSIWDSRKKSPFINTKGPLFFSLVDYRNNYFISDDPNRIIEFYNGFENRYQLIQWMKERPKGVANIHEVDGDKDIIVVIPTADINGKYAKECRENIFRGLHIIFVESGEYPDPYFNYAHNCNVGIRKAMEYNPKWIVVSNDDMEAIDNVNILMDNLKNISNKDYPLVFANPENNEYYVSRTFIMIHISGILKFLKRILEPSSEFGSRMPSYSKQFNYIFFASSVYVSFKSKLFQQIFRKHITKFINFSAFGIFSTEFIKVNGILFDETFINGFEDTILSLTIESNYETKFINYNIFAHEGATLGSPENEVGGYKLRHLRNIVNYIYADTLAIVKRSIEE